MNYHVENNGQGSASKVSFVFSKLVLEGEKEHERGNRIIYPIYIVCI